MVTKWKKWASVIVLFLGFYLALAGCAGTWYAVWGLIPRGLGPELVLQGDYRETAYFRREITSIFYDVLNALERQEEGELWANADLDTNLLYTGTYEFGSVSVSCSNTDHVLSRGLPDGYDFLLAFRSGRVIIIQDGERVDVYGDGYYTDQSRWDVPGYRNRRGEDHDGYTVYLAVASQPVDHGWWEPIWSMKQVLTYVRYGYLGLFGAWAGAVLCLTLAAGLRKARREAREAIAVRTAKVWFEVKLALAILPALLFWQLLTGGFFWGLNTQAALVGAALLLCYPPVLYCLGCDLRHNRGVWRNSLCAALGGGLARLWRVLRGAELSQPLQRRFLVRIMGAGAGTGVLALLALWSLFRQFYDGTSLSWMAALLAALLLVLLFLLPLAWLLDRVWVLLRDLVPLTERLSVLRAGASMEPLKLPEGSDLREAAADLNRVQEGLRSAVEQQMRSERMKVELIANVSHDLKTPLTSVVSYAALLGEEEELPPHVKDYVRILNEKARRLQVMVQDVFEVSKAASGELPLKLEQLDLTRLLDQTLADMDEAIRASGLTLRTTLPGGPVWITADGDRLYRVFQNLIQNALRYSLEGSRVYLTLEVRNGRATATMKNTSRDELPAGMDFTARFVRGDESRTDGGSGLGLAIASSFTTACGGALEVETDADLFTVRVSFPTSV